MKTELYEKFVSIMLHNPNTTFLVIFVLANQAALLHICSIFQVNISLRVTLLAEGTTNTWWVLLHSDRNSRYQLIKKQRHYERIRLDRPFTQRLNRTGRVGLMMHLLSAIGNIYSNFSETFQLFFEQPSYERLQGEDHIYCQKYLLEMRSYHSNIHLKSGPKNLNFLLAKIISKRYTVDCSYNRPCTFPHSYAALSSIKTKFTILNRPYHLDSYSN